MGLINILQQGASHGMDGTVELLAYDVVEDYSAGAVLLLGLGIIREVDAYDLEAGIGVTAAV